MKAIRIHTRAGPEALVYEQVPVPEIHDGEALVRVHATGITPTEFTWNSTFNTKDGRPRLPVIPGFEVAGTIERTAPDVSGLSLGDAVYGLLDFWRGGGAAEYVATRASGLAHKPDSLDFVHAAAIPLSALTAWQGLFDHAKLSKGGRVLIHGAGGGVGTYAVQLAKWHGAYVVATCSKSKAQLVRELGADKIIDYASTRFENEVKGLDAVLDTVGGDTLERSWEVLRKGGTLVTIVGDVQEDKAAKLGVRGISMLVEPNRGQLTEILSTGRRRQVATYHQRGLSTVQGEGGLREGENRTQSRKAGIGRSDLV